MSSPNSPCAACKLLRRKCTQDCVFAPYFPPDQPHKFAHVHRVFGASNVAKLLNELNASQREDAVNSLSYEAECRLRDPVYGCVGLISILQHRLKQLQGDLSDARKELAKYVGPQAMLPSLQNPTFIPQEHQLVGTGLQSSSLSMIPQGALPMRGNIPSSRPVMMRENQQQQMIEAQQLAALMAARENQGMLRTFEQQPHQQELLRYNIGGFDPAVGSVTATGFNQMTAAPGMAPSLALATYDNTYTIQPQQLEPHLLLQSPEAKPQVQQPQQIPDTQDSQQNQQRSGSEERVGRDPSC